MGSSRAKRRLSDDEGFEQEGVSSCTEVQQNLPMLKYPARLRA